MRTLEREGTVLFFNIKKLRFSKFKFEFFVLIYSFDEYEMSGLIQGQSKISQVDLKCTRFIQELHSHRRAVCIRHCTFVPVVVDTATTEFDTWIYFRLREGERRLKLIYVVFFDTLLWVVMNAVFGYFSEIMSLWDIIIYCTKEIIKCAYNLYFNYWDNYYYPPIYYYSLQSVLILVCFYVFLEAE